MRLLGTPLRTLAAQDADIRARYREEFNSYSPRSFMPRLYPHPDEVDRLATERTAA